MPKPEGTVTNLGRRSVLMCQFSDDKLLKQNWMRKVVYERDDGTFWISLPDGPKRVGKTWDGRFRCEFRNLTNKRRG